MFGECKNMAAWQKHAEQKAFHMWEHMAPFRLKHNILNSQNWSLLKKQIWTMAANLSVVGG